MTYFITLYDTSYKQNRSAGNSVQLDRYLCLIIFFNQSRIRAFLKTYSKYEGTISCRPAAAELSALPTEPSPPLATAPSLCQREGTSLGPPVTQVSRFLYTPKCIS